jgi:hypothetical protein
VYSSSSILLIVFHSFSVSIISPPISSENK